MLTVVALLLGSLVAAPAASAAITISGTAYDHSNNAVWAGCSAALNIGISVNGAAPLSTNCSSADGSFSLAGINTAANQVIAIYFNTNVGGDDMGIVYTRPVDNFTNITGIELYNDEAVLRSETATGWTNGNLEAWDQDQDPNDVPIIITGTVLTTTPELRLRVNAGDTYTPTGNVTVPRLYVEGTYNGAVGETLTFTGGGDTACTSSSIGNLYAFCNSGTFNAPPLTRITSPTTTSLASGVTYQTLEVQPTAGNPIINLGYAWCCTNSSAQTLVIGTGAASVTASAQENTFTVTGNTTINALATLNTENGGTFEGQGNVTGAGATTKTTGGVFRMRPGSGATVLLGPTSGATEWAFHDLRIEHSGAAVATVRSAAGGSGRFYVDNSLTVGLSTDSSNTVFDVETVDRVLDVRVNATITSRGTLQASSTSQFSIGGNFTKSSSGVFTPGTGTVTFVNSLQPSKIDFVTTGPSFYNLSVTTPAKVVRFDNAETTTITNNLTVNGGACGTRAGIASTVEADAADINVLGTASIQYADVRDANAITALAATNSTAGPNNTNWTITGSCATVTIAGNSYEDAKGTVWSQCDGVTPNMALSINGYGKVLTTCSAVDGSYSFTPVPDPGLTYLVYQDRDLTPIATGATYGLAPSPIAGVTDVDVVYGEVRLRSDSGASFNSQHLNMYDSDIDPTIGLTVVDGYYHMYLHAAAWGSSDNGELHIEAGTDLAPDHFLTATAIDLRGTLTHTFTGTMTTTILGAGTSTDCDDPLGTSMPICAGPAGAINEYNGGDAVVLTSTLPYAVAAIDYPSLRFMPAAGDNPGVQLGGSGNGTLRVQGELQIGDAGNDIVVDTSTHSPYIWVDGDTSQIGNLEISTDSSLTGTSDVRVDANMLLGGAIDMTGGTFEYRVEDNDEARDDVGPAGAGNHLYHNLVFSTSGGARNPDFQTSAGTIHVRNDLQVGRSTDAGTTTLVNNTINESIDVDGSVLVTNRGSLSAAANPATTFTIGDDFTNQGTFTGNGGRVTFDTAANISTISTSAATTFSNLLSTTPSKRLRLQHAMTTTVTGTFTADGGSCGSPVVIESTLAGVAATINMGVSAVQFASLRDSTAAPARNATTSANLVGNTGWTFVGGCTAPTTMLSHDTNASGLGIPQHPGILVDTPHFSWINNAGLTSDRSRTQVVNTPVDANVVALWQNDGNGNDVAGSGGGDLVPATAPNDTAWDAASIQPGFGQSLVTDGDDAAIAAGASSSLDIDTFTVEAWVRISSLTGAIGTESVLVTKDTSTTARNFRLGVLRSTATTGVAWADISTGGAAGPAPLQGTTDLDDGQWHHVAYTVNSAPADPSKVHTLVVDGVVEATALFSGNVDNPAVPVAVGASSTFTNGLDGRIDDVRISNAVRSPGELKGYVRSRMPHGTVLWDSDPSDAGIALASCNNLARCADVIHGGAPVVRDGARYHVRGKLKSTTAIWSGWSTWDWFETASGITINIPSGLGESFGTATPNTDVTSTSDIEVWSNDRNGYTLLASGPDDTWGMDGPGAATIPRFTAPPDAPASWPALTPGYFGFTVLAATGGKNTSTWGTGATATSFGTLNYAGLQSSRSAVVHRRNSYSLATDTITTSYRANVAPLQQGGAYTTTVQYTVLPNV
jgi:hypothetical protein